MTLSRFIKMHWPLDRKNKQKAWRFISRIYLIVSAVWGFVAESPAFAAPRIARSLMQALVTILILALPCATQASWRCQSSVLTLPKDELSIRCANVSHGSSSVTDWGVLAGSSRFGKLFYQLIQFDDVDSSEAIIFKMTPSGHMAPFICNEVDAGHCEQRDRPRLLSLAFGNLLAFPPIEQGTAGPQGALLFEWIRGHWRSVDLDTWQKDFAKRISPHYVGWRGVGYDFQHMAAESFLYAPGDAHSGPSGYAKMHFAVMRGVLRLGDLSVGPSKPVFDAMCRANPKCHSG